MPFVLPKDGNLVPYVGNVDSVNNIAVPMELYVKVNGEYVAVSETNPLEVSLTGSNAIYNGTYTPTGTAAEIATSQACSAVVVQNDPINSNGYIYVGNSSGQTIALAPGASHVYEVSNVDMVWAKTGSGTQWQLNWEAKS